MSSDTHGATTLPAGSGLKQPYHLVDPSPWPIIGAAGGGLMLFGIIMAAHFGNFTALIVGALIVLGVMFFWWRDVVRESRNPGMHTPVVRVGLRYGMTLFIASEVMFFVAFFWAFFNFALYPEHVANQAVPMWPPQGVETFDPFHLPILNTMILLLSGTTITWAHHCLIEGDRKGLVQGLALTVLLGLSFTFCQGVEYSHAPFHLFGGGVYPGVFFLATGFHGFHVIVGTTFLIVCLIRAIRGHFTPQRHFGFEAAAWYWHFVDVVWLFLFICIYWWGHGVIAPRVNGVPPAWWQAALKCRCPHCGEGALFTGLLAIRPQCSLCHFSLRENDTGDGAVALVIMLLGAVVVGLAIWVEFRFSPPFWVHVVLWPPVTLGLGLGLMRLVKAALVALQFRNRSSEMGL